MSQFESSSSQWPPSRHRSGDAGPQHDRAQGAARAASSPGAAEAHGRVLVAARDLAVGTRLTDGDMMWQAWPADSLNASFITDAARRREPPRAARRRRGARLITEGGPAMQPCTDCGQGRLVRASRSSR